MKYLPLVWTSLWRKPARTVLSLLSLAVAFGLYAALHGVSASFAHMVAQMSETRLYVQSRVNLVEGLPISYLPQIEKVPGVTHAAYLQMVSTYYKDRHNPVLASAVNIDDYVKANPDIVLPPDQQRAMEADRTGVVVGRDLANRFQWKIGDHVPLIGSSHSSSTDPGRWEFDIVGIYDDYINHSGDFLINFDYYDEARFAAKGRVNMYFVTIDNAKHAGRIAEQIDDQFANSSFETRTESERDFMRGQLGRVGNVGFFINSIIGAVFFTILILTVVVMIQSVRERVPEFAVMKTFGFTNPLIAGMVVAESLALCLVATLLGSGFTALMFPKVFRSMGLPGQQLPSDVIVTALCIGATLAGLGALAPVIRIWRLTIIDALSTRRRQ